MTREHNVNSIVAGCTVRFNDKYDDLPNDGKKWTVVCIDEICGEKVAWLYGKAGCVAVDALEKVQ